MVNRPRIEAVITATAIDFVRLTHIAQGLKRHIRIVSEPDSAEASRRQPVRLHFTSCRLPEPIVVDPDRGVEISTWDADGVCHYAGIDLQTYLLICSLIGLAHWRVLHSNSLLRLEDLQHPAGVHCVYTGARQVSDIALLMDSPAVCGGCVDFYHCLGADTELVALREVLSEIRREPDAQTVDSIEFDSDN